MGEWKQTETYPKRMAQSIKETRERIRLQQREEIKKSRAPVQAPACSSCGSLLHSTDDHADRVRRGKLTPLKDKRKTTGLEALRVRVASVAPQANANFPYTRTHRARRYLKKHPGFAVDQHPGPKGEQHVGG
jgi:hypothetical protein